MNTPTNETHNPIIIAVPNIIEAKMQAIVSLCRAVETLSKTLDSANIQATVANNTLSVENGPGIQIGGVKDSVFEQNILNKK